MSVWVCGSSEILKNNKSCSRSIDAEVYICRLKAARKTVTEQEYKHIF